MNSFDPIFGPLQFIVDSGQECVLAVVTKTEGPTYRTAGAIMAIAADGSKAGSLSSGCIEADIVLHSIQALATNRPTKLRYGQGSQFIDLRLPCGGGIEILLLPRPNLQILRSALQAIGRRIPQHLVLNEIDGSIAIGVGESHKLSNEQMTISLVPRLAFRIFGNGVEVVYFANLAETLGFDVSVFSPDAETISKLLDDGHQACLLKSKDDFSDLAIDQWTAILLFFHDHDWEPEILRRALESDAFYIGAQGSRMARLDRDQTLREMGIAGEKIARISGPIGLIPATRDPRSLAVSVLAEVLAIAKDLGI